ncbi:MAG: MMPL family transporter [Thermoleophilaceae bacterium]|nr:MMPL family transporter [Thermoleophilaceae bacterium]
MQLKRNKKVKEKYVGDPANDRNIAARAGRWSATHKKTAIVGWFAFVVVAFMIGGSVGQKNLEDWQNYTGESATAEAALHKHYKPAPANEVVVVQSEKYTVGDPQFDNAVKAIVDNLEGAPNVVNLQSQFSRAGPAGFVSEDGHTARLTFDISGKLEDATDKIDPIVKQVKSAAAANPQVTVYEVGDATVEKEIEGLFSKDLAKARNMSLPITLFILFFAFGALVAAGIPVLLAITAVMATIGLVAIPSHLTPMDESVAEVIILIGMAVGVDYSLFYIKREREERAAGRGDIAAIEAAAATSGRAVLISGITVLTAMAGMLLSGDKTFISFGIGTMIVVAIAMVGSLTVLPALLSALGDKLNRGRIPFIAKRRERRAGQREVGGAWSWIVDVVLKRPLASAVLATAVLVAIALPALNMKTQDMSANDLPANLATIQAYDKMDKAFPAKTETATVVYENADVHSAASKAAIAEFSMRVANTKGFAAPEEVTYSEDGKVVRFEVPLVGGSDMDTAIRETRQLRGEVIPETLETVPGATVSTTGGAASSVDFSDNLKDRAPLIFGFVLSLAFLLLLITFRSIVVPIKAIILNLLSVAAAYGVLVLVFQNGWGHELIGFEPNGSIAPFLPMFLFVILFGLSMDYHVFILSRIKEAYDGGMSSDDAVRFGIRSTAGVVTSAAVVMVAVFAIFGSLTFLPMKQMGVGLSAAILIDATIIRAVLLPATMKLLGDRNWYLPSWLEWLPQVKGEASPTAPTAPTAPRGSEAQGATV